MQEDYNANQIIRKDARGCFVESLKESLHAEPDCPASFGHIKKSQKETVSRWV